MKVKNLGSGVEYNVNEETATNIRAALHLYDVVSVHTLPLSFKRDGDTVVRAAWARAGGPQAFTNGH